MEHPDPVLAVSGLVKRYGGTAVVDGIAFSIRRGECFALLGPNGAGKTTTLRLCLGLVSPDEGSVELVGRAVPADARRARIRVGVVPQLDNLDPDFSVEENLMVYGRYFGLADRDIAARIPGLLAFANLETRRDAKLATLSGGMKRRLTLARALINDPDLIFMDEPTTGLDPQARHLIWERLKQLLAQGKTIFLTTHFMDEAERLATRLAVMDRGRFIAAGAPRDLIASEIEREVVEVYGDGVPSWARANAGRLSKRFELTGETAFCYTDDARELLAELDRCAGMRYIHRPANLEDVFLKLTGREMRD